MNKFTIISSVFVLLLSSCGGSSEYAVEQPINQPNNVNSAYVAFDLENVGENTELEGTWSKPCGAISNTFSQISSDQVSISFRGYNFRTYVKEYTDENCQSLITPESLAVQGNFIVGDSIVTSRGIQAKKLTFDILNPIGATISRKEYNIFLIENGNLVLGDLTDTFQGLSLDSRPNTLNFDRVFYPEI